MSFIKTNRFIFAQTMQRRRGTVKTSAAGRDIVFYCGRTDHVWGPDPEASTHIGGSEEAVIHLTRALARLGWNVTVYNNCGRRPCCDAGVIYCPHWEFDPRQRQNAVVLWRQFKLLGLDINADKVFVDLHDVGDPGVKPWRLRYVDRVFVRSQFHRSSMPTIPDDKIAIVPNGLDLAVLNSGPAEKDPYLLINTSAPERSMDVLPSLFREVKRRVPQARLQWAFGWDIFEAYKRDDPSELAWAQRIRRDMAEAGIEPLGRLNAPEIAALYRRASIYAYPTAFPETDCISVKKAQACGCVPVASEVGALAETVQGGIRIPLHGDNPISDASGAIRGGIKDAATQAAWVDAVVALLQSPARRIQLAQQGIQWASRYDWSVVAECWDAYLREPASNDRADRRRQATGA